jgi:hypothetical protein
LSAETKLDELQDEKERTCTPPGGARKPVEHDRSPLSLSLSVCRTQLCSISESGSQGLDPMEFDLGTPIEVAEPSGMLSLSSYLYLYPISVNSLELRNTWHW